MTRAKLHFHLGLDQTGHRHTRLRSPAEIRRAWLRRALHPHVLVLVACRTVHPRWRNGMQQRHFMMLTEQTRGDRRCFLMTLRRPPLVSPVRPF